MFEYKAHPYRDTFGKLNAEELASMGQYSDGIKKLGRYSDPVLALKGTFQASPNKTCYNRKRCEGETRTADSRKK